MIHAIYIYFIINAFIAGAGSNWKECLRDILVGLPYHILDIAWSWIKPIIWRLNSKYFFISFIKLWFTDKYKWDNIDLNKAKEQYKNANWFKRKWIKQLDKKYKYGITTEKPLY